MTRKYIEPRLEIICFNEGDIVCTSGFIIEPGYDGENRIKPIDSGE